ncbi:MAG: hypothetical protein PHG66_04680 [Candidatus Colwellbacteria bacterium]|nr:hypothetical protein [Candidatus Colwellbacteria bacterium]
MSSPCVTELPIRSYSETFSHVMRTSGANDVITIWIGRVKLGIVTRTGCPLANSLLLVRSDEDDFDFDDKFVDYEDFRYASRLLHNGPD